MSQPAQPLRSHPRSRTEQLRQRILSAPYEICIERARYYTQAYRATEGLHPALRSAKALARTLDCMSIYILDEERIVGNRSSKLVGAVLPVERGEMNVVLKMELDALQRRPQKPFVISEADKKELLEEIFPYWEGKTVRDLRAARWAPRLEGLAMRHDVRSIAARYRAMGARQMLRLIKTYGSNRRRLRTGRKEITLNNPGLVMNIFDDQGHLVLGHKNVIAIGFRGIKERAEAKRGDLLKDGRDKDGIAFLDAVILCCDAVRDFALRFASEAERLASRTGDPARRHELETIARHCRKVPYEPPEGFHEAVQFLWFTQVVALIAYGMGGIFAIGRPDQYLCPYYEKDIAAGRIDRETALGLVEELLIKLSYNLLVLPSYAKETASELGADNQAVTLGGVDRRGDDAANPLTYLFLDAVRNIRNMSNSISIRVHKAATDEYWSKVAEVISSTCGPALYADEVVIPALVGCGYTLEDARDYAIIGCVEPTSEGNTFGCTSGNDISLVGALEMVFNRGRIRMSGAPIGPDTGDPAAFRTFEEFWDAYKRQVKACVDLIVEGVSIKDRVYAERYPCPYVSSFLDGCIERARDMTQGGARYTFGSVSARGLATAADSLTALRKLVYQERRISMGELKSALDRNYRGTEPLRQMLLRGAPKYGNDNDEADEMAKELAAFFCEVVSGHTNIHGGRFRPSFFSYGMHVYEGSLLGATPDGRRAGEPISNSLSPSNGAERNGPTAVLLSAAKIDHTKISNGSSLNLKLNPSLLRTEEGRRRLVALLKTYFGLGGMHVQLNVVSTQTLREAQLRPDWYQDLVVRVSGYSAYFVDLGKAIQDDIIARTEFERI